MDVLPSFLFFFFLAGERWGGGRVQWWCMDMDVFVNAQFSGLK